MMSEDSAPHQYVRRPASAKTPTPTGTDPTPESRRDRFRGDIQGLRAIAVVSVVLYHGGIGVVSGGYVGVDIFFVISGFLITSHLLRDVLSTGRLSFASFYARRARRILPAAFAVNILTLVAAVLLMPATELASTVRDAVATALYVPNMIFAGRATDYLAQTSPPSLYQHFWSLGVEEQFYLLWPLLLVAVFALVRRRRWALGLVIGGVALVSFAACVRLTVTNEPWAFFTLPTRAWEFAVGGLVALIVSSGYALPRVPAIAATGAGVAGLAVSIFGYDDQTRFPGDAAALPILATALLILAGANTSSAPTRWLGNRPMVFIGEISYSLYLVHWPILTLARYAHGQERPLALGTRLVLLAICLPVAYLLYRLVENPVRRNRRVAVLRPSWTLAGALGCSLAVVVAAVTAGAVNANASLTTSRTAAGPVVVQDPTGTPYVPSNLQPTLSTVSSDNPASYADGCHLAITYTEIPANCTFGTNAAAPLVVLFGDSHAAEWFPALEVLAESGQIRLESDTKSGCPSATLDVYYISGTGPQPYPECPIWRAEVIDRLKAAPPALVVLSNYNHPDLPGGGYPTAAAWATALKTTIAQIPTQTTTLVMGETPLPGDVTPSNCLAAHLTGTSACNLVRTAALVPEMVAAERQVAQDTKSEYADLSAYMCNDSICPPIIGNVLVYRDSQHLTATFAKALAPVVGQQIEAALAKN